MMNCRGMGAVNPSKLQPKAEKSVVAKKGGKVKKFSGEDEESLVRPISSKYTSGSLTNESVGAELGGDGAFANVVLPKMTRPTDHLRPSDPNYLPAMYTAGYRTRLEDSGLSGSLSMQDKMRLANLMADTPLGDGNLQVGLNSAYRDGRRVGGAKSLGYSGRVGGGELMGRLIKPEGQPMGAELRYSKQFKKGGKARKKK